MNMRDYLTLKHYTQTQIKVKEQVVIGNNIDVNEHEGLPHITLRNKLKQTNKVIIGNNIDVNEHEGLPNITLRHKLKQRNRL